MRIASVRHLRQRRCSSRDVGIATVTGAGAARPHRRRFPPGRPAAARCTPTPATPSRPGLLERSTEAAFAGYDVGRLPVRFHVRGRTCAARHAGRRVHELSELLVDVLGVTDVGARFPHRVTYHPTCHGLRMLRLGDRPLRLLARGRRPRARRAARRRGVLRLRRHVRAEERRRLRRHARRQVRRRSSHRRRRPAAADNSCLAHIGGGLSRRPGAPRPVHYAEILAASGPVSPEPSGGPAMSRHAIVGTARSPAAAERAGQRPAAGEPGPRHPHHPGQAGRASSAELPDWDQLRDRPAARSRTT